MRVIPHIASVIAVTVLSATGALAQGTNALAPNLVPLQINPPPHPHGSTPTPIPAQNGLTPLPGSQPVQPTQPIPAVPQPTTPQLPPFGAPGSPIVAQPNPAPMQQGPLPDGIIKWDSELKEFKGKMGETNAASFTFSFTNISSSELAINLVQPSCGCTTVQLPPMPWKIAPGTGGEIPVRMTISAPGTFFKNINVLTDKGQKLLMIKSIIDPAAPVAMTAEERNRNVEMTKADPQAIFKGDCVRCHVQPAIGKVGKELYDAACGVCHEAEHRASIVPSLHALPHDTNAEFWRNTVAFGKPGSLMPPFSAAKGGPLSDPQIATLVDYLVATMPAKAVSTNATHQAAK